ncbi:MAG TPA: hypothetical protein VIT45_08540 [Allosphingosinicella sp.]
MNMQPGKMLDADFQLVSTEQMADAATPHGDSVRRVRLGTPGYSAPTSLYLVYVKFDGSDLIVRHMSTDTLINGSVSETEQDLFDKAQAGNGAPEQVGRDFATMAFKDETYFTIVLDNDLWDFYFPNPTNPMPVPNEYHDPIMFIESKVTMVEQGGGAPVRIPRNYEPNTSFYDATSVSVRGRAAVRCINYFRDSDGSPLRRYQDLGFEILVRVPFALSAAHGTKLILIIDPDGQNQGPAT